MADEIIKISELAPSTDIYDGCCFPIVTNDETKKITYALLKQKLQNDLEFPEREMPNFAVDVNGHLLVLFEGEAPIDIGKVKGDAGKFGSVTASVDNNTGTPYVVVTYDGDNVNFAFHNLKGTGGGGGGASWGSITGTLNNQSDLITALNGKASSSHQHTKSDITDLSVPTKTSDLTNDSGFLTEHQSLEGYATETYVDEEIASAIGNAIGGSY